MGLPASTSQTAHTERCGSASGRNANLLTAILKLRCDRVDGGGWAEGRAFRRDEVASSRVLIGQWPYTDTTEHWRVMTAPIAQRIRIVVKGSVPGGEVWATGFTIAPEEEFTLPTLVALEAGAPFQAMKTAMLTLMAQQSTVDSVAAYVYAQGPFTQAASIYETAATGPRFGTGTSDHPAQIACVISQQGLGNNGTIRNRSYLLANGVATTQGLMATATVLNVADRVRQFLAAEDGVVFSPKSGEQTEVDLVYTDIIPDTQRRRRDALRAPKVIGRLS